MNDLIERLQTASALLEDMAAESLKDSKAAPYSVSQLYLDRAKHLTAKAEGVRLALSYAREYKDERV